MIGWRERRRIEEKARLRRSAERETKAKWWKTALAVINTPIVLAVVVSSILGFTTETFHRSETCVADLSNANQYWKVLATELTLRLELKMLATQQAGDDLLQVAHAFAAQDLQEQAHINKAMKEKTFVELLLDFDTMHTAFALADPPPSANLFVVLPEIDALASQQQFTNDQIPVILSKGLRQNDVTWTAAELKSRVDLATSEFLLYTATHKQLPYDCRWLAVAKRELTREPSPFGMGAIPGRSD